MPKIFFTPEEIDDYLTSDFKHFFKEQTEEIASKMKVHADGEYPESLLDERRPNEPLEVKEYRKKIWIPITKPYFLKVFTSLQKIRRSQDWSIRYEGEFPRIAEEETLEEYSEKRFPYFTSVTNWVYSILLRKYLIDPNALVFVFPLETGIEVNQFLRPFPVIFDSVNVIDFKEEDYVVLVNPLGSKYTSGNSEVEGKSFYIVTTQHILKYDEINSNGAGIKFQKVVEYPHGLEMLPVFKLGGIMIDQTDREFLYESRLSGMIPEFDEAVREYSDLQAAKVLHIYPERWEFTNSECTNCKGTGLRSNPNWSAGCGPETPSQIECEPCHGRGYKVAGPYSKMVIHPINNAVEAGSQIPNPPAGYVQKDIDIVKVQDEGVDKHIFKALASMNFEFLFNTPLSQSGVAKEVDKDELNNAVHSIAEDIVRIMDNIYKAIARYRYKQLYSIDDIEEMLPEIAVPEKYDLLSATHTMDELTKAKTNKTNPVILNAIEVQLASKMFGTEPEVRDSLMLELQLDPLPNVGDDEKSTRLAQKGITQETYVISSNIHEFVQQAIDDSDKFVDLTLKEQKKIIKGFATKQIEEDQAKAEAMKAAFSEDTGGLDGMNGNGAANQPPPTNGTPVNQPMPV